MIARNDNTIDRTDLWAQLAAPLPHGVIAWRQDGRPVERDGRFYARFVAYIEANTVRERLDGVVPGEWDLTLELLPAIAATDESGEASCSFKARLQILGVIREDVGTGRDYKSAATDAFKRAAVRFGIAHELYAYEQNWVPVDGDSRYAKPLEDPAEAYARKFGRAAAVPRGGDRAIAIARDAVEGHDVHIGTTTAAELAAEPESPSCPRCGGRMWDNRLTKRNPKAPDYKCRTRSCDGVIWPSRRGAEQSVVAGAAAEPQDEAPALALGE